MRTNRRYRTHPTLGGLLALACLAVLGSLASCGGDRAYREYIIALQGEEKGMTREEQIAHLTYAISLKPKRVEYWETRGLYRTDLRQFDLAMADLDHAMEMNPRPYLHYMRGLVMCQRGEYAKSLADFDAAIAGQPENTQFYRGRSLALSAVHNGRAALDDAEKHIAMMPQRAEGYYARAKALMELGRYRDALPDLDQTIKMRPELVYPLVAREECHERLGETVAAAADDAALARATAEHGGCAMCTDQFRY
jgi:tetratricopeptide (TPR) repeat protein